MNNEYGINNEQALTKRDKCKLLGNTLWYKVSIDDMCRQYYGENFEKEEHYKWYGFNPDSINYNYVYLGYALKCIDHMANVNSYNINKLEVIKAKSALKELQAAVDKALKKLNQ